MNSRVDIYRKAFQLQDQIKVLEAALRPFVEFLEAFERNPIASLDPDEVYSIHGGHGRPTCPEGASIRWDDLRAARAALHGKTVQPVKERRDHE